MQIDGGKKLTKFCRRYVDMYIEMHNAHVHMNMHMHKQMCLCVHHRLGYQKLSNAGMKQDEPFWRKCLDASKIRNPLPHAVFREARAHSARCQNDPSPAAPG